MSDSDSSCPRCGAGGIKVSPRIVKIMATPEALAAGVPEEPLFCRTEECPVVYFGSGGAWLGIDQVRVPVFAKHPGDRDQPVCYCFGHSVGEVLSRSDGPEPVSAGIRELVRARRCACELRNPKETCCLGDVMSVERAAGEPARGGCDAEEATSCCRV